MEKEYMSLNYANDNQEVLIHNQYGPVAAIAKLRDGRWHLDMSEVRKMEISDIADELENRLHEALNSRVDNNELNVILQDLRRSFNV